MIGSGQHQVESINSQRLNDFLNLERERDRENYQEGSVHTTHMSRNHFRGGSHISQRQNNNKAMQREIDDLKKKLRHTQRKRSPSSSDVSSNDEEDASWMNLSPAMKSATTSENTRAHLAKA